MSVYRADAGLQICMIHTGINTGEPKMARDAEVHVTGNVAETDQQRKDRTGLSSLRMADDESAAVQKTANRVSLEFDAGEDHG